MNLKQYKERLERHDWFHHMSHDPRRYDAGYEEQKQLEKLKEGKKTYEKAYQRKVGKMFPKTNLHKHESDQSNPGRTQKNPGNRQGARSNQASGS